MIHVSCVQMAPKVADPAYNLAKMKGFVEQVCTERPETDLIVFPELAVSGYLCTKEEFQTMSRTLEEDESVRSLCALAKKYRTVIVWGLPERDQKDPAILYNSAAVAGKDGFLLGCYRKVHPFDTEKKWCRAGSEYPLFEADFGRFGVLICWDTAFPEAARTYALRGADLLVVCTNWETATSPDWPMDTAADWDLVTRARAFDNVLHLVSANRVGCDRGLSFFGHSNIIDPVGRVLQSLNEPEEGVVHASLDLDISRKRREEYYTIFEDRRPDTYGEVVRGKDPLLR